MYIHLQWNYNFACCQLLTCQQTYIYVWLVACSLTALQLMTVQKTGHSTELTFGSKWHETSCTCRYVHFGRKQTKSNYGQTDTYMSEWLQKWNEKH